MQSGQHASGSYGTIKSDILYRFFSIYPTVQYVCGVVILTQRSVHSRPIACRILVNVFGETNLKEVFNFKKSVSLFYLRMRSRRHYNVIEHRSILHIRCVDLDAFVEISAGQRFLKVR